MSDKPVVLLTAYHAEALALHLGDADPEIGAALRNLASGRTVAVVAPAPVAKPTQLATDFLALSILVKDSAVGNRALDRVHAAWQATLTVAPAAVPEVDGLLAEAREGLCDLMEVIGFDLQARVPAWSESFLAKLDAYLSRSTTRKDSSEGQARG